VIPISKPHIGIEERQAVDAVLKSGMLVTGKVNRELEKQFAKICGTKYALAVNNGTAALHTALQTVINPGEEVITTPFTFVATANAILMCGGVPVYADIDEKTYNIDPSEIEKRITKKTKAILTVNLYGQPADYKEIKRIARKYKLKIIEDAAQSVGAAYYDKMSGNLGDIACFSLYATKNIMCGEGGIITTNSKKYYNNMAEFRNHGQPVGERYIYTSLGYNYRLTDIHAALAVEQCKRLKTITKNRQNNAALYNKEFGDIPGIIIPTLKPHRTHVYHQYTIRVTDAFAQNRDSLQKYLIKNGIYANIYYPIPLYRFKHLAFDFKPSDFPVTEHMVKEVLSIPVHAFLTNQEKTHIIKTIKKLHS